jgi:outer membrane receptor protein involved in Fe transport
VLGTTRLEIKSQWQGHSLKEVVGDSRVADDPPSFDLLLNTFTTDILLHHARGDWLSGTIGVSGLFQNNKTRGVFPLVPAARTSDGAIFAFEQASWSRWSVLLGARGDAHHIATDSNMDLQLPSQVLNASAFSGDAGVVYRPVAGLAVAANIGRAFRAPTLFELFSNGPHLGEDRFEIGLATARPEVSFNADLSLRWERPRFRGEIAVYRNSIEHYLYIEPNGATAVVTEDDGTVDTLDVYQYKQTSRAVLQGLDLSTEIEAIPALTLRGRFDFVHGDNDATAQPLPLMPPARVDLEAELHTVSGGPSGRSYVTLATQIVAKQTRLGQFDTSTEGYALLHLGGGVAPQLWGRRVFLDIRVRNALNQRYNDFLSRYKLFAYEMGRNVVVRVSTGI